MLSPRSNQSVDAQNGLGNSMSNASLVTYTIVAGKTFVGVAQA
jgi:hypothetical protein